MVRSAGFEPAAFEVITLAALAGLSYDRVSELSQEREPPQGLTDYGSWRGLDADCGRLSGVRRVVLDHEVVR